MRDKLKVLPFPSGDQVIARSKMNHRLAHGPYVADFYTSDGAPFRVYHYIITLQSSPEILFWGQCRTKQKAARDALDTMRAMHGEQSVQRNMGLPSVRQLSRTG
jgi:hypothetical protein